MQGLVVVGLIFEEIPNINVKGVKVNGAQNIGQVTKSRYLRSMYFEEKHYARFGGCRPYG